MDSKLEKDLRRLMDSVKIKSVEAMAGPDPKLRFMGLGSKVVADLVMQLLDTGNIDADAEECAKCDGVGVMTSDVDGAIVPCDACSGEHHDSRG